MNVYLIFFAATIIYGLCADKINETLHVNKELKKVILTSSVGVCLINIIPMLFRIFDA